MWPDFLRASALLCILLWVLKGASNKLRGARKAARAVADCCYFCHEPCWSSGCLRCSAVLHPHCLVAMVKHGRCGLCRAPICAKGLLCMLPRPSRRACCKIMSLLDKVGTMAIVYGGISLCVGDPVLVAFSLKTMVYSWGLFGAVAFLRT